MTYSPVFHAHFVDVLEDIYATGHDRVVSNVDIPPTPSAKTHVLTFLSEDNKSGFALVREGQEDTELCSVFSTVKGRGDSIMTTATALADTMGLDLQLNCFDGYLVSFYARYGFIETERVPNWDPEGPDVVYMRREAKTTQTDQ